MFGGATVIDDEDRQNLFKSLEILNTYLEGDKYLTGSEEPTLADVIIFVGISNVVVSLKENGVAMSIVLRYFNFFSFL